MTLREAARRLRESRRTVRHASHVEVSMTDFDALCAALDADERWSDDIATIIDEIRREGWKPGPVKCKGGKR